MSKTQWLVNDREYLETQGGAVLVYHDFYPSGMQGGIEIIHHGERVAANGGLRIAGVPFPESAVRQVAPDRRSVTALVSDADRSLEYRLTVAGEGGSIRLRLDLARPLPADLAARAEFAISLYPPAYFRKTYHVGSSFGVFPQQANGPVIRGPEGRLRARPLGVGQAVCIAPEDPLRHLTIEAAGDDLELIDDRNFHWGGWFIVRSRLRPAAAEGAAEWLITPHLIPGWTREPVIGISQVGYHPDQVKQAIIELDPRAGAPGDAQLLRIDPQGKIVEVMSARPAEWGRFLCYVYAVFDFTEVRDPGLYVIRLGDRQTPPFRISADVYREAVWQPTLETYLPVQMCHVKVVDRARVWHGACHLDDAIQAPAPTEHFDGYAQGPTTDTPFQAYEHIPYCDRGGWHDAGDYDLAAGSQATTTFWLALARETFGVDTDQTTILPEQRLVRLHVPDGVPDIVQQVSHGVQNLLSGYRAAGHSFSGIIEGTPEQNYQMGDASTRTDNLVYDPSLGPEEVQVGRSGRRDDRWAFTSRDTSLEYECAAALAAASRVLRDHDGELAQEALDTAARAWEYEQTHPRAEQQSAYVPGHPERQEILATAELLITTGQSRYRDRLVALLPTIVEEIEHVGPAVVRALPAVADPAFKKSVEAALEKYSRRLADELATNPYGVPFHPHVWGIGWQIQDFAAGQYFLAKAYPRLFDRENVLRVVNYVLGCHPASNVSFASGVGADSILMAYGANLADWWYIPGGVVSGTALIRPDFPELKDDYPFLWQQVENVIGGAATYIFCVLAAEVLLGA